MARLVPTLIFVITRPRCVDKIVLNSHTRGSDPVHRCTVLREYACHGMRTQKAMNTPCACFARLLASFCGWQTGDRRAYIRPPLPVAARPVLLTVIRGPCRPARPRAARWEGGSEAKPFVATALANMQHVLQEFKCCCPANARRVFDRMPARDRVAWNKRNRLSSSAMETVSRLPDAAGGREQGLCGRH